MLNFFLRLCPNVCQRTPAIRKRKRCLFLESSPMFVVYLLQLMSSTFKNHSVEISSIAKRCSYYTLLYIYGHLKGLKFSLNSQLKEALTDSHLSPIYLSSYTSYLILMSFYSAHKVLCAPF